MVTARVFQSGNSQAVRLPKECRLSADKVFVNRIGNVLMLVPTDDPWGAFSQGVREIGADFPATIKSLRLSRRSAIK